MLIMPHAAAWLAISVLAGCGWPSPSWPSRCRLRARCRCGPAGHARARPGRVREMTLTPSIWCPRAGAGAAGTPNRRGRAVRLVGPPCWRDSGRPGFRVFPGRPARVRPVRAPPPARAGILRTGISAGRRAMYLGCTCGVRPANRHSRGCLPTSWPPSSADWSGSVPRPVLLENQDPAAGLRFRRDVRRLGCIR